VKRWDFIAGLGGAVAWPQVARAQQFKRVGTAMRAGTCMAVVILRRGRLARGELESALIKLNHQPKFGERGMQITYEGCLEAYRRGDYPDALTWTRPAAEQGNAEGQYLLGRMYGYGEGVPQDFGLAMTWLRRAADQGSAEAQYQLGLYFGKGGVPKDPNEAQKWYLLAATNGNAEAQYSLGEYFHQRAEKDFDEAFKWYLLAANQGDAVAQYCLGDICRVRWPPEEAYVRAFKWYSLAANQGNTIGQDSLAHIETLMTPAQILKAQKLAREWKPTTK
jgi:TPR repeat protein